MPVTINGTTGIAGVDGSAGTPAVQGADTNTGIFFPAADTIAFAEGGAEVARFDSSGNFGIGTAGTIPKTLTINGGNAGGFTDVLQLSAGSTANNSGPGITFNDNYGNYASYSNWQLGAIRAGAPSASANFAGYLAFFTNNATSASDLVERARIDSSGNLLVGQTSDSNTAAGTRLEPAGRWVVVRGTSTGSQTIAAFYRADGGGSAVGSITTTNTATSYVTSSDYRLKHDIAPMTGALAKVAALKPVTYKWNVDNSDGEGFIAHELAEVAPGCVTGEKDAVDAEGNPVYQGIDTSFLVATLTAAIQEQQALIESLTARIAALEAA